MLALGRFVVAAGRLILRNRAHMVGSMGVALISVLIFGFAAGGDMAPVLNLGIHDADRSALSDALAAALTEPEMTRVSTGAASELLDQLRQGRLHAVVVLPEGLEQSIAGGGKAVQLYYDETRPNESGMAGSLVSAVVAEAGFAILGGRPLTVSGQGIAAVNLRPVDWLTPSLLGMMLMWGNLYTGTYLVEWRGRGILRRLAVTPLRPWQIMTGQMAAQIGVSLLQAALFVGVARLAFDTAPYGSYLNVAVLVLAGSLTLMAFGLLPGALVNKAESAGTVTMLIAFPMMFLGQSFFSLSAAPVWLQRIAEVMPLYHLNEALRAVWLEGATLATLGLPLLVLTAWCLGSLAIATAVFRWD